MPMVLEYVVPTKWTDCCKERVLIDTPAQYAVVNLELVMISGKISVGVIPDISVSCLTT